MAIADANLILRDGSSNLVSTTTGSWIDLGANPPLRGLSIRVVYPVAPDGTGPTCDLVFESSDDNSNAYGDIVTLKQETSSLTAGTVRHVNYSLKHRYVRYKATIGGSGMTNGFGKVWIGVDAGDLKATR